MTDPASPSQPLCEHALSRLRKLAAGNGIEPAAIAVIEAQEEVFILNGAMEISPLCESESALYAGGIKGKDRKSAGSIAALPQAAAAHQKNFRENPDWIAAVTTEIKTHDGQGWGLENAKVTLPEYSAIFAATEICPSCQGRQMLTCGQCHGQGVVICTQCQGQGREQCYHCGGNGDNPHQPGQPCQTCNGTRLAPCRFCQSRSQLPCPTCQGRRGTPCVPCRGTGKMTQEIAVTCGAETHFKLGAGEWPSGLRRGLDRVGIINLGKGHADITVTPPPQNHDDARRDTASFPILAYRAALPYAEMRMTFGHKKAALSAFGKRCILMGVPPFLDDSLKPWRDKLRAAAQGKASLHDAIEARALRDILALTVAGRGDVDQVRKIYPFGLSAAAIKSILADTALALNQTTLKTRAAIATACAGSCLGLFYILLTPDALTRAVGNTNTFSGFAADFAVLAAAAALSWAVLTFSTRVVLKKRFPQLSFALHQKTGKTGYAMLAAIAVGFILCLLLSRQKLGW